MTRREKAIRAAVESLNMSREAKDAIVDIWREVDDSYAEAVRDLKARLKAMRKREQRPCYSCGSPQTTQPSITDLRRKNWREP